MQFIVEDMVFDLLPEACFGVVVATALDNSCPNDEIWLLLGQAVESVRQKFRAVKPKEHPDLKPFREAFIKMGVNPNKYPCSVEALTNRIVKGGTIPDINPAVNLVNACSLKYTLPMGAHDLDASSGLIEVRLSRKGDRFLPFGETVPELLDEGELVYADRNTVKTRKWIWRQSDFGKVTEISKNIFFPIDGFIDSNLEKVIAARDELAAAIESILHAETISMFLDKNNRSVVF